MSSPFVPSPPYSFNQELGSNLPLHILENLNILLKHGKKLSPRTRLIVEFCRKEGGTSRPDEETFSALQAGLREEHPSHWREVVVSAWVLGQADLTPSQRDQSVKNLAFVLDSEGKTQAGQWFSLTAMACTYGALWGVGALLIHFFVAGVVSFALRFGADIHQPYWAIFIFFAGLPLCGAFIEMGTKHKELIEGNQQIRREAASSLGSLGGWKGVPALLRASQDTRFYREIGAWALERTLPSLQFSEHYGALESDVVPNLCRLLHRPCEVHEKAQLNHVRMLLDALGEVGDRRAIETLEELAQRVGAQRATPQDIVQKTEAVLQIVRERVARETEQATLLRGSDAPVVPETLLRSYEEKVDEPQEQLLRPTQKD